MNKLPNHTALKEWSNVVAALARAEQQEHEGQDRESIEAGHGVCPPETGMKRKPYLCPAAADTGSRRNRDTQSDIPDLRRSDRPTSHSSVCFNRSNASPHARR